jgi:hypothetical protein
MLHTLVSTLEYINWATRKFLCHTLLEKYRKGNKYAYVKRVNNMRIEYITWAIRKNFMSHTGRKYRKNNEYAYRIY